MSDADAGALAAQVLILAPAGRDAAVATTVLTRAGFRPQPCADMAALCRALTDDARAGAERANVGVLLLAEEALAGPAHAALLAALAAQPAWSDVPVVVLTGEGELSHALPPSLEALTTRANVTLLERPVRVATLVSALRSALRARRRQLDVRDHLAARAAGEAALRVARAQADEARTEAERANRAKSEFLAVMSHELRTPINALTGYTQLLELGLAGPLTGEQRGYLERMTGSARHLLGLVEDVLDLSRIEAGETRVAHRAAETGPAVSAALDLVRPQAATRGVGLVDQRPDAAGVPFVGDEDRVRQVVLNLLGNAVKFTPAGGTVTITCDTRSATPAGAPLAGAGPWAVVQVADTGPGIVPEEQARIFEPFHQVDSRHTRETGGTGLGLAISRRLARLMGGDLTVESRPGAGATFTLWLPATVEPTGAPPASASARAARAAAHTPAALQHSALGLTGAALRDALPDVLTGYCERLRSDPALPQARELRRAALEDHAVSLVADIAQSLVLAEEAGGDAASFLADGGAIQRAVAETHGARRHAQGWDEAALRRDHQALRVEIDRAVRARLAHAPASPSAPAAGAGDDAPPSPAPEGWEGALHVLHGLLDRVEALSVAAWRRAVHDGSGDAPRPAPRTAARTDAR